MMFKHDCNKHGHRFEARYTKKPNKYSEGMESGKITQRALEMILYYDEYVHDVCTRCGKIAHNKEVSIPKKAMLKYDAGDLVFYLFANSPCPMSLYFKDRDTFVLSSGPRGERKDISERELHQVFLDLLYEAGDE